MKPAILLYALIFLSGFAQANIEYREGSCFIEDGQIYLTQDYDIHLADEPLNALRSGIVLYFIFETELAEDDGWFATSHTLQRERVLRYDHISRQFILEDPITLIQQSFSSPEAALETLGSIEHMSIANVDLFAPESKPILTNSLRLNVDKLPVSLRLSTLFDNDWSLKSESWQCQPDA